MQIRTDDGARSLALRLPAQQRRVSGAADAEPARVAPSAPRHTVLTRGLRGRVGSFDPGLNARLSGAQQALDYLDQLGSELSALRAAIRDRLAPGAAADAANRELLDLRVRRFGELWSRRPVASAGTLDAALQFHADGAARQTFRVRGLDLSSLRSGNPEIISFAVGAAPTLGVASVAIEPGLSGEAIVRRLDHALAGIGIRASASGEGELRLSVPDSDWPRVRDTLSVRGEGQRFPTGRFSHVRAIADEPAIRPQEWQTHDTATLRATREKVFVAEGVVRQARKVVAQDLAAAGNALESASSKMDARAREALTLSEQIGVALSTAANGADYGALAAALPAVSGISREKVSTLLRMDRMHGPAP
ncbi:MAG TPA: hypothetical protein VG963_02120 [Polyangiaceae bacterium]|nr:hypothetical protein [Polyangiaceae bacterium]